MMVMLFKTMLVCMMFMWPAAAVRRKRSPTPLLEPEADRGERERGRGGTRARGGGVRDREVGEGRRGQRERGRVR